MEKLGDRVGINGRDRIEQEKNGLILSCLIRVSYHNPILGVIPKEKLSSESYGSAECPW